MATNIRKIALELLHSYEMEGRYVNLLLSSPRLKALSKDEMSFLTALLYGTVEKKIKYDYIISALSSRQISEIDPYVRDVLRLGLCQILDMDSIPDFATVNESVKLARHKGEAGFINALLRKAVKSKDNLPLPKREKNVLRYISVNYSIPLETVKLFASIFGKDDCESVVASLSSNTALSITVNENKISRDELLEKLADFGAKPSKYSQNGIIFEKSVPPKQLPGFDNGDFFVQDEASRISSLVLGAELADVVIDVCAAPGGKTLGAAIRVGKNGQVYSFDLHESKLSLIDSSVKRLGLDNVKISKRNALDPDETLIGMADKVICDVPCSGFGVFGKKPDLRYKDLSEIVELPPLQYSILEESAKYLKQGGIIVYSTCTFNPAENEGVTDKFISEHPEFSYESCDVAGIDMSAGKITLLPHVHGTDGFYIAKLRKNK